jgi:N-acetyl sugar amidotransferase
MRYCKRCLYPDTKPDLTFNEEGICSACISFDARKNINWDAREHEFKLLVEATKDQAALNGAPYDCIVPVSGGKDSTYQVIKAKKYGLRILAVTATTCHLSDIGRCNLDNISRLGVDHIEVTPNRLIRKKLNKLGLFEIGDCSWPEHVTIFTVPFIVAREKNIPLIIWGENPQNEYGSPNIQSSEDKTLNGEQWLNEFGGLNGLRVEDIIERGIATREEMELYTYPPVIDDIQSVYMGYYFPWDGFENYLISKRNGFMSYSPGVQGHGFTYENLDNYQTGLRDYLKYLKFGFGRATDIVNNHIRRGRMTREQGIDHVSLWEGVWPAVYMNRSLEEILGKFYVTIEEFQEVCDRFANPELFEIKEGFEPRAKFKVGKDYAEKANNRGFVD